MRGMHHGRAKASGPRRPNLEALQPPTTLRPITRANDNGKGGCSPRLYLHSKCKLEWVDVPPSSQGRSLASKCKGAKAGGADFAFKMGRSFGTC